MARPRFQLLSRAECHLCHEMEALLNTVLPVYGEEFVVEDVDSRRDWQERFGEVIPVLLRDGRPVAKVRLDSRGLRRIVERSRPERGGSR